jgi:hypothetical protein
MLVIMCGTFHKYRNNKDKDLGGKEKLAEKPE